MDFAIFSPIIKSGGKTELIYVGIPSVHSPNDNDGLIEIHIYKHQKVG